MKKFIASAVIAVLPLAVHAANYSYVFSDTADNTASTLDTLEHGTAYTWGVTNASTVAGSSGNLTALESSLQANSQTISSVTLTISNLHDWVNSEADDVLYANLLNGVATGQKSFQYMPAETTFDTRYGDDPFNASTAAGSNGILDGYNGNQSSGSIGNYNPTGGYKSYYSVLTSEDGSNLPFQSAQANSLIAASELSSNPNGWANQAGDPGTFSADDTGNSFTLTYNLASQISLLTSFLDADNTSGNSTLGLGLGPDCYFGDSGITLTINTVSSAPDRGMSLLLLGFAVAGLFGYAKKSQASISI